jgi:hypothetical protein
MTLDHTRDFFAVLGGGGFRPGEGGGNATWPAGDRRRSGATTELIRDGQTDLMFEVGVEGSINCCASVLLSPAEPA